MDEELTATNECIKRTKISYITYKIPIHVASPEALSSGNSEYKRFQVSIVRVKFNPEHATKDQMGVVL